MAGHAYLGNEKIKHMYLGNVPIKKGYIGNENVFSTGNICTYNVDGVEYSQEYDEGQDVLNPTFFPTPTKEDYQFLGWNTTSGASTPLSELVMGDAPITLYAVWKVVRVYIVKDGVIKTSLGNRSQILSCPSEGGIVQGSGYIYLNKGGVGSDKCRGNYFASINCALYKSMTIKFYTNTQGTKTVNTNLSSVNDTRYPHMTTVTTQQMYCYGGLSKNGSGNIDSSIQPIFSAGDNTYRIYNWYFDVQ